MEYGRAETLIKEAHGREFWELLESYSHNANPPKGVQLVILVCLLINTCFRRTSFCDVRCNPHSATRGENSQEQE